MVPQPITNLADVRSVRRQPALSRLINQYHRSLERAGQRPNPIYERDAVLMAPVLGHALAGPPFEATI
jgi:hypothetical protein